MCFRALESVGWVNERPSVRVKSHNHIESQKPAVVNVAQPVINMAAPVVNVAPPMVEVTNNIPQAAAPDVHVHHEVRADAPIVHVSAPVVNVANTVDVGGLEQAAMLIAEGVTQLATKEAPTRTITIKAPGGATYTGKAE
jgi:hypothetical protein